MVSWELLTCIGLDCMKRVYFLIATLTLLLFFANSRADSSNPELATKVAEPPAAATTPSPSPGRLWNLQDADILSIINEVSLETGKNFVIDPRVSGKISLISSKPLKPNEVYNVFLSILSLLGYSAVPSGDVIKIVPNMESSEYPGKVATRYSPGSGDEVVVRVFPLENVSANQLIPVIRPLLPQWSNVTAYTPGNVLIVVGRAANLERIMHVIDNIEKTADTGIEIVPLHQASATQMANVLNNLQNAARANGDTASISIAPDERSNSILLSGNKAMRFHMRLLIERLDTPNSGAQGNTEVIYLRYLKAKSFAPILGKIAQNLAGKGSESSSSSSSSMPAYSNGYNSATSTGSSVPVKKEENFTSIQAEPATNSLIITAPPAMMTALNSIVAKLDIRPAQVLVEAIIVEMSEDDLKNLGFQYGAYTTPDTVAPGPGFQQFGEGTIRIIPGQQLQAILSLLETYNDVNILSTPSVVVLDNHKAILDIGQDVPVQTGQYATTGAVQTATPFTTTNYRKVTLSLEVTPQINLANSVRMGVILKNDTLQNPSNPGPTPLINTSKIANSVIVNNADILVIGGLIKNSVTDSVDKVPFLGDIPCIGSLLFSHKTRQLVKRNLVVFIQPLIMHNQEDADAITNTKYNLTRDQQITWPWHLTEGQQKAENILPLYKNNTVLPKPFTCPN